MHVWCAGEADAALSRSRSNQRRSKRWAPRFWQRRGCRSKQRLYLYRNRCPFKSRRNAGFLFSLTPQLTLAWVRSRLQEAGVNCGVAAMDLVSIEPWVLLYAGSAAAARGRRVSHELRTEMINAIMVEHGTKVTMTWLTGILRADGYACPAKARQR